MIQPIETMYDQALPVGELCEECGEVIQQSGTLLFCENGCFNEDTRNYLSENWR